MACFPFLNSHKYVTYSEDFFGGRGETFVCKGKTFSRCFLCRIYVGSKMKNLISCHVKTDAAVETKIVCFLQHETARIYFGLKSSFLSRLNHSFNTRK